MCLCSVLVLRSAFLTVTVTVVLRVGRFCVQKHCVVMLATLAVLINGAVPPIERAALVEFFDATTGSKWRNGSSWLQGDPCDDRWFGIFCNSAKTHVTEIFPNPRWSGNTLRGTIPTSLFQLSELQHLYLSNDRPPGWSELSGSLPTEIGRLSSLKCLYTSHAGKLTGTLPSEISGLTRLQGLYSRWTKFQGALPDLSRLTNLSKIIIDSSPIHHCPPLCSNAFSGTLAALASWNLPLAHLDVADNDFSGPFPTELCKIDKCTAFGNHFTTKRPKGCCDGLTADEADDESSLTQGNECHPHDFPGAGLRVW